ncbi:MAG: hypothetical protein EBZ48_01270 [Proteobacteria bacterium]|nr:hypothetical protein [Pseudomonadota bacterium]
MRKPLEFTLSHPTKAGGCAHEQKPHGKKRPTVEGLCSPSAPTNIGSNFSTSTGKFTAPVTGTYSFSAAAYSAVNNFSQAWLVVNGSRANGTDWAFSVNANFTWGSWVLYLSANDTVGFHPYNGSVTSGTITTNVYHTWFRGCLIG